MNSFFTLPKQYQDNLAKILKGSVNNIGCSIHILTFKKENDKNGIKIKKIDQVKKFIKDINQYLSGFLRLEIADQYVIPLVYNRKLLDSQKLPLSSDSTAMAFLILSIYLLDKQPITEQILKERLMRINKESNEINKILRDLTSNGLINRKDASGMITYEPTNVLYSLIPEDLIFEILDELGENKYLENIFSQDYTRIRENIMKNLESEEKEDIIEEKEDINND